jgi:osmotically-inducible protein OsmY
MRKACGIAVAIGLGLGVAWWGGVGRAQQEGAGQKAGEKLDEVGRKIKRGLNKAEEAVRESFHKTRESVHSMGVAARVYGRLHWDKALQSSTLNVKVEEGVATLTGSVPTAEARTKAVNLAADTVGVNKVVDELTVTTSRAEETPAAKP